MAAERMMLRRQRGVQAGGDPWWQYLVERDVLVLITKCCCFAFQVGYLVSLVHAS
jgi:hypothetical protein